MSRIKLRRFDSEGERTPRTTHKWRGFLYSRRTPEKNAIKWRSPISKVGELSVGGGVAAVVNLSAKPVILKYLIERNITDAALSSSQRFVNVTCEGFFEKGMQGRSLNFQQLFMLLFFSFAKASFVWSLASILGVKRLSSALLVLKGPRWQQSASNKGIFEYISNAEEYLKLQ